jgi:peroxiredoxin Q/BCP
MVKVGDAAPNFRLQGADGQEVTLSALRGKPVVLYFFPKALTSG